MVGALVHSTCRVVPVEHGDLPGLPENEDSVAGRRPGCAGMFDTIHRSNIGSDWSGLAPHDGPEAATGTDQVLSPLWDYFSVSDRSVVGKELVAYGYADRRTPPGCWVRGEQCRRRRRGTGRNVPAVESCPMAPGGDLVWWLCRFSCGPSPVCRLPPTAAEPELDTPGSPTHAGFPDCLSCCHDCICYACRHRRVGLQVPFSSVCPACVARLLFTW